MKTKFLPLALCGALLSGSLALTACGRDNQIRVYAPDGAPALALSALLAADTADDGITYTVTSADTITTFVTGQEADVCILPVNSASILPEMGDTYQMVGLATHGNLYLLSAEDKQYTRDIVSQLQGKKIGAIKLNDVPGLTLRATFADLGLSYVTAASQFTADNVYLYGENPANMRPTGAADLYLLPEPQVSVKLNAFAGQLFLVGDLQALYGGEDGYPQAAVVAKKQFIQAEPEKFAAILAGLSQAENYLTTASIAEICEGVAAHREKGLSANFTQESLTREAILRSNVRFESSLLCRAKVDAFLQKLSLIDGTKAMPVGDNFYYIED